MCSNNNDRTEMPIRSDVGSTHDHHHRSNKTMAMKVNRDSHLIKKSPLTPTSKTQRQPQPPLIIYAHAPRVIHTKPQEFKALVQTLTGCTGNKNTTAAKGSPPAQPLTPHLPPPSKVPMYCDFDDFETKNVLPLTNSSLFSIDEHKHNASSNMNISCLGGGGEYFAPPIPDLPIVQHQAKSAPLPFFAPTYGDRFCGTNTNFSTTTGNISNSVGIVGNGIMNNNNNNNNNRMFYNQNYVAENGNGSGCYYSDGVSSSLDLSSSPSSLEEAMDEFTDFS